MTRFEEWVNDFTIMGDDGAVIFSSYDRFVEFIEEIVVDERKRERKALAELLSATPEVVAVSENGIRTVKQTPKKEWVGLADEEREHFRGLGFVGVLAVEAKLKEKNT